MYRTSSDPRTGSLAASIAAALGTGDVLCDWLAVTQLEVVQLLAQMQLVSNGLARIGGLQRVPHFKCGCRTFHRWEVVVLDPQADETAGPVVLVAVNAVRARLTDCAGKRLDAEATQHPD